VIRPAWIPLLPLLVVALGVSNAAAADRAPEDPIVLTQVPRDAVPQRPATWAAEIARSDYGSGARIILVGPSGTPHALTNSFHSAADPDISFDGRRMLFAGKREASDNWNIFEMVLESGEVRQITKDLGDCRQPVYQGTLYTIVSTEPWHQVTFVSTAAGELNEHGALPSTSLYSCMLDGSAAQRLTYNPSADVDPAVLPDGRLVFSSWQRSTLHRGVLGRVSLFSSHTDGLDYALFSGDEGRRIKLMPAATADRLVVFVEGDEVAWDGSGSLASVSLRRNLHSYRPITRDKDGLFHSPSALPDGSILVSRRSRDVDDTHGVYWMDSASGRRQLVFDDPEYHDVQARVVRPRPEPDGRSSVVKPANPTGKFYCLNVYDSDLPPGEWIRPGRALRLRVLEGIPQQAGAAPAAEGLLPRRFLGEIAVEDDGSFNIEVPPNIPIELQLIDEDGVAVRSCSWIWVRNNETRGCIGCHEDPERTPENRFVQAVAKPSIVLTLPPEKRRSVEYRRDIAPILSKRCAECHEPDENLLADVVPGRARSSPLAQRLLGRVEGHPGCEDSLTDDERRTVLEWIDLGAQGEER
jgi:Tol biopolymer transport system component